MEAQLKLDDIKTDRIYYNKAYNSQYIFRAEFNSSWKIKSHIYNHNQFVNHTGCEFSKTEIEKGLRHATAEEIAWLEACEAEGMFVSKPIININEYILI